MRVCRIILFALFAAFTAFGQAPNPPIKLTPEQVAQGKAILAQYKAISLQCVDLHNASHRANQALATDPSKLPAAQDAAAAEAAAQQQLVEKAGEYKKLTAGWCAGASLLPPEAQGGFNTIPRCIPTPTEHSANPPTPTP